MMLTLASDAIVAVLLVATIAYASVLNRRLGVLRNDKAKLEELIQGLTTASQRAEAGVAGLKAAAEDTGRQLEQKIELARSLRDDLSYMLDRGEAVADRLEGRIRARRDGAPASEPAKPRMAEPTRTDAGRRDPQAVTPLMSDEPAARRGGPSRAERDLLRALAGRR